MICHPEINLNSIFKFGWHSNAVVFWYSEMVNRTILRLKLSQESYYTHYDTIHGNGYGNGNFLFFPCLFYFNSANIKKYVISMLMVLIDPSPLPPLPSFHIRRWKLLWLLIRFVEMFISVWCDVWPECYANTFVTDSLVDSVILISTDFRMQSSRNYQLYTFRDTLYTTK